MATDCIAQVTFGFEPKDKPVVALFDMPYASSDGGAILLKGLDTQFQLTKRLAACVTDGRQPGKVQHQTLELLRGRECWTALQPFAERAVYVNGLEDASEEGADRVREAYGANYERLAALKKKYDPTNFLTGNQNIEA